MVKYHKIRNVPLEVCSAEQKIAYNLAFNIHINYDYDPTVHSKAIVNLLADSQNHIIYIVPLITIIIWFVAVKVWNWALKKYRSTGN